MNIILHVFAAKNSANRKGIGFIPTASAKWYINGVNVKITTSFEVKIVKIETVK